MPIDRHDKITAANCQGVESLKDQIQCFNDSDHRFQVLWTLKPNNCTQAPKEIFILDACFNPPTVAHLSMAVSGFGGPGSYSSAAGMLILMFCTNGTRRAPSPALLHDRIHMIKLLIDEFYVLCPEFKEFPIDIALTKETTFVKKSAAIATASQAQFPALYDKEGQAHGTPGQIYLVGSDNFLRILQPEFYPGSNPPLSALAPLFDNGHGFLCFRRPDSLNKDDYKPDSSNDWFKDTLDGKESDGFKKTWTNQVRFVETSADAEGVSSTMVRKAANAGEWDKVNQMCPKSIAEYIRNNDIYAVDNRGLKHTQNLTIGISGCTSSGKTTLTALLRQLLPKHTIFIHGDVFGRPFEEMPIRQGFADCDSRQSVRTGDLKLAIKATLRDGFTPATYQSFEALDKDLEAAEDGIDTELFRKLEHAISSVQSRFEYFETILVVDGFMLYHDADLRDMLDIKLLLRASRAESWRRRSNRYGPLSEAEKEFWQTKPYFDACVWHNYKLEHQAFFPDVDIEAPVESGCTRQGIFIQPKVDATFSETHTWAIKAIVQGIERNCS